MLPIVPFTQCPAKVYEDYTGMRFYGHSVPDHCYIVGKVARELVRRIPAHLQDRFFPHGVELVVACHDVGKVSPTFYLKLKDVVGDQDGESDLKLREFFNDPAGMDKSFGGHSAISAAVFREMRNLPVALITGSHHGAYSDKINNYRAGCDVFGAALWQKERTDLVAHLAERLGVDLPKISHKDMAMLRVLCGLTSVADWIGSGGIFSKPKQQWEAELETDVVKTLDEAGFIQPVVKPSLGFMELFGFSQPNELQIKSQQSLKARSVIVVEAPMGVGKTETALNLAYKCLTELGATGIYFALPTQLTSNKIYERFNGFLENILQEKQRSQLIHGQAWLLKSIMGEEGDVGGSWFDQAKRGLLAPFGVGTLDQALLSVIQVKHNFVRSFGLMGKVVILDEVHSYDVYTSLLLDELIKHLIDLKCTVIILSATLNSERKKQLLGLQDSDRLGAPVYPCITNYAYESDELEVLPLSVGDVKEIQVIRSSKEEALNEAVSRAMEGQYVLWIENSVDDAIEVFQILSARLSDEGIECGLLHSRMTTEHRMQKEDYWVSLFGKSNQQRNTAKILVGTQILEQSLDIDADFLVTSFAPTDFVLQRLGRLWRHKRPNRNTTAVCEAWVVAQPMEQAVVDTSGFGKAALIYGEYILLKSLNAWERIFDTKSISLPDDISPLIEQTYSDQDEQLEEAIVEHRNKFLFGDRNKKGISQLRSAALSSLAKVGAPLKPEGVATRFIEMESVSLYLFEKIEVLADSVTFTTMSGDVLVYSRTDMFAQKQNLKKLLIDVQTQEVTLLAYHLNESVLKKNQEESPALVKEIYKLVGNNQACFAVNNRNGISDFLRVGLSDKKSFYYSEALGLHFVRN